MRASLLARLTAFVMAGLFAVFAAWFAATVVEESSIEGVEAELAVDGITWAEVDANGLQLFLAGIAPTEAARFDALTAAGRVVDAARVIDQMNVAEGQALAPPRFSIEILSNNSGVSLIGLVPASTDRERLMVRLVDEVPSGTTVSDFLETASFDAPEGWDDAVEFGVTLLDDLPQSKISIEAGLVTVRGMAESDQDKRRLESDLARRTPDTVSLALALSAPRPVITPFTLRYVLDEGGGRFDACSAATEEGRDRIVAAAGLEGKVSCTIGLGVPSKEWPDAISATLAAVRTLGGGSVTVTDADITLVAAEGTDQALFDSTIGDLSAALPDVFVLSAALPEPPDENDQGPPEFVATLGSEGGVQIRGRLSSEIARQTVDSFAKANFGSDAVRMSARIDEGLPATWQVRVLAAMDVLARMGSGSVTVGPDTVAVVGRTGNQNAKADITALLTEKLGEGQRFDIAVTYVERLDPSLGIPPPEECERQIAAVQAVQKITFEPGAAEVDEDSGEVLDEIAEILKLCRELPLEIQGHTDSQGREVMNQELSQARAETVLNELRARRVLTASFRARGYGEANPIADNGTEDGREDNRRIEFHLITEELDALDEGGAAAQTDGAAQANDGEADGSDAGAGGDSNEQN